MISRFLRLDPITFLSTTILFCILRMVVPHMNLLFVPLLIGFCLYTFYHLLNGSHRISIKDLIKYNWLLILTAFLLLTGNIISGKIIFFAVKEVLNAIVILLFALTIFLVVKSNDSYERFTEVIIKQILISAIIVSVLGLIKYVLQLTGINLSLIIPNFQFGTSLNTDYNFNALFSLLGIQSLLFFSEKINKSKFILFLLILVINIIFSGSRRGLVFLFFTFIILTFWFLSKYRKLRITAISVGVFLILSFLFLLIYLSHGPGNYIDKNKSLDQLKSTPARKTVSQIGFRYFTFINSEKSSYDFYLDLFAPDRYKGFTDPEKFHIVRDSNNLIYNGDFKHGLRFWYPESSKTDHHLIDTPFGKGIRVSKSGDDISGWPLLYAGRDIIFYSGHTYQIEFKFKVQKGEGIPFSIGFQVADKVLGPGKYSNLFLNVSDIENGWRQGICSMTFWKSQHEVPFFMNLQQSNTIVDFADIHLRDLNHNVQLHEFADQVSSNSADIYAFLHKNDSINFSNGQKQMEQAKNLIYNGDFSEGNRFWLPSAIGTTHEIIETPYGRGIKVTRAKGDNANWSLQYAGRPVIYNRNHEYRLDFFLKVVKGTGIPFNVGWWTSDSSNGYKSALRPLVLKKQKDGWNHVTCSYRFLRSYYDLPGFISSLKDSTEIIVAAIRMEDLNQGNGLPLFVDELSFNQDSLSKKISNKNFSFTNIKSGFYGSRLDRWKYSLVIFKDSLSFSKKILGSGFGYIYMYGRKFNEGEIDYPHNPFLSTLIFSGVIGLILYFCYMLQVILLFIKYYNHHRFFFISFVIVFFFSFVSSNTHFSVPVFAFLCVIPFVTKSIQDNKKKIITDNHSS
jgi:hypothetical protein